MSHHTYLWWDLCKHDKPYRQEVVLKIYSQINDHLPYKETDNEGFYPSIPEEIEKMDKIDLDFPSDDVLDEEHYFAVIVNL